MTEREVNFVIDDRFRRWGSFLRQRNATPVMVVGVTFPANELVVTVPEEMVDEQIRTLLVAAVALIDHGRQVQR